jgi:hypothetical protein
VTAWVPSGDELTLGAVFGVPDAVLVTVAAGVVPVDPAVVVLADGVGDELVHGAIGAGAEVLGFARGLGLLVELALAELLPAGLTLAELLPAGLTLAELLPAGLTLPLSEGLTLVLAGLLVSVPLDEVSAAAAVEVEVEVLAGMLAPLDEADVLALVEAWAVFDGQAVALPLGPTPAIPDGFTVGDSGEAVPAAEPGPPPEPVPVMSALISEVMSATSCRVVGTTASTTPRTNTAMPAAKAGRSIASRQSRREPGPGEPGPGASRAGSGWRIQSARDRAQPGNLVPKSRTASHTAIAP